MATDEKSQSDLTSETLLSLKEAILSVPMLDGRRPDHSTIWRWCKTGTRGVKLEYVRIGHKICTSQEALARFWARLTEVSEKSDKAGRPATEDTR